MSSATVADFLLRRLSQWDIRRIFGYPGDGIDGVLAALERAGEQFHFVQVRHEAVLAAAARLE
jgi:pyruvate dehydrogenase (quinone)